VKVETMNLFDDEYRAVSIAHTAHLEVLTDDGRQFVPHYEAPLRIVTPADMQRIGRDLSFEWLKKLGADRFAAVRIFVNDQMFVYSIYDLACLFFGVKVLTVGQMPVFRSLFR
jgi:hypothetical protein